MAGLFDDLIPSAPEQRGGMFDDLIPKAQEQSSPYTSGVATTFGYRDPEDNGKGAWGDSTNNPTVLGVSLPVDVLRAHFGDENKAHGQMVEVVNPATGATIQAPIVDKGPSPAVEQRNGPTIDLTYAANQALGGDGKTPMQWRILGGNQQSPPAQKPASGDNPFSDLIPQQQQSAQSDSSSPHLQDLITGDYASKRPVGFWEALGRSAESAGYGAAQYANSLVGIAPYLYDQASKIITGKDPGTYQHYWDSMVGDVQRKRENLAIQPSEKLTTPGQVGDALGTLPRDAALAGATMAGMPEVAAGPEMEVGLNAMWSHIVRGTAGMIVPSQIAGMDAMNQSAAAGQTPQQQLAHGLATSAITLAGGAIPLSAEGTAPSLLGRLLQRGATGYATGFASDAVMQQAQALIDGRKDLSPDYRAAALRALPMAGLAALLGPKVDPRLRGAQEQSAATQEPETTTTQDTTPIASSEAPKPVTQTAVESPIAPGVTQEGLFDDLIPKEGAVEKQADPELEKIRAALDEVSPPETEAPKIADLPASKESTAVDEIAPQAESVAITPEVGPKSLVSGLANQARKRIKNLGPGAANAAEFENGYATIGLEHLLEGRTAKPEWMDAMRSEFDYFDDDKLNGIWNRSQKMLRDFQNAARGRETTARAAIERASGVKQPVEKVSVNPVVEQKRQLRAAEKAGAAGYKRGVRETWAEARVKIADLKAQLKNSVTKAMAFTEYLRGMQKGSRIGAAAMKKKLAVADRWLAADVEDYRRKLVDYVQKNLPVSERGKFVGMITRALERPALVGGDWAKLARGMIDVTEAVDARAKEVYRENLASEIRKSATRALRSPSVDLKAKNIIERALSKVNLKNPSPATIEELSRTAEYLARMQDEGKEVEMPARVFRALAQLAKTPLDQMSTAALEDLHRRVTLAERIGRVAYKSRAARWQGEKELRMSEMESGPSQPMESNPILRAQPGETLTFGERLQNRLNAIKNGMTSLDLGVLPQDVIFDMLQKGRGSYEGPLFDQVRTPIDAAYDAAMKRYGEVKNGLREIMQRNKLGPQSSERIGLWATLKQENGERRALDSGVEASTIQRLKAVGLNSGEMEAYNYMRRELDGMLPEIQDIMHQLYNVSVEPVKNYFPFMREWETYKPDLESPIRDSVTGEQVSPDELSNFSQMAGNFYGMGTSKLPSGFTLERKANAGGPIRFDAFEVFERHMVNAARLVEMQRELKMAGELVRSDRFAAKYGMLGQRLINEWLTTTANDGGGANVQRWRMIDWLNRGTSRSMVFFNLVSNIKHLSAVPMGIVNAGGSHWWWSGLAKSMSPEGERFISNFPQVAERNAGEVSMAQFQQLVERTRGASPARLLAFADKYGFILGKAIDESNSRAVFIGRYLKNLSEAGKVPTLDAPIDQRAAANALSFMRRTVSSTHAKDLPATLARGAGFYNNVSLARAFFQFHQFVLERWSQMRYDLPQSIHAKNYTKTAAMVAAMMAAVAYESNIKEAVDSAVAQAWSGITGNPMSEKKKRNETSPAERAIWDVVGLVPYSSPILAEMRYGETGVPLFDAASGSVKAAWRAATDKKPEARQKAAIDAAGSAAELFGVPGAGVVTRTAKHAVTP